ncbi:MFS transporter [Ktedonobacter sp. SOSP1-85]|uniref:MFS transporter n=1 Tax=Ktedonobacter sp. SOSP1-85 TaxID=2778367 RepID=UPI001916042C|nr:MFS transporter [Ktedonobacter sp. SOSP1-85]GHO74188.1 MFS transporter [Ktedonobacter sp. SOSP1-85]
MLVKDSQTGSLANEPSHITPHAHEVLAQLDNSGLSRFHWKAMITSGMGFFTDAYDLFIIGAALTILNPLWHLNALETSLVASTSLVAAALGSYIFGLLADRIGRHAIYGLTLIVLAAGAIISALSPNIYFLLIFRFIMGLGIGGDYPLSATLMSEYSNRKDRGKLITMVFSMQGLGLILGPLVALILLVSGLHPDLTWRIMLALGAVPALATFYLRRQIEETPRYALMMHGNAEAAQQTISNVTGNGAAKKSAKVQKQQTQQPKKSWFYLLFTPRFLKWVIGTAGAWFLLDIAYYGTTISGSLVLKSLNSHADTVTNMLYTLGIFVIAAMPGYIVAALTIDRLGRKKIQCIGFAMMTLAYGLLALVPGLTQSTLPFLSLYALSYFFTEFGPNVTTFVYPAEIFPTMVRSSAHGLAAALGKLGAFIGAFAFPYLLTSFKLPGAMGVAAVVSLLGLLLTIFTLPEPNQRSLEEIAGDHELLAEMKKEQVPA